MVKPINEEHISEENVIYCKDCIWFKQPWCPLFPEKCNHPNNWVDTWLEKVRRPPSRINQNNDCKWFERSPYRPESKPD